MSHFGMVPRWAVGHRRRPKATRQPEHATRKSSPRIDRIRCPWTGRVENESFTQMAENLDSVGKSLAISWMSEFLKVLPQLKLLSDEFLP